MTTKFAQIFRSELAACKETGTLPQRLHELLRELFTRTRPETQEVEGVNGMLKRMLTLSLAISLELLSSRMVIKKANGAAAGRRGRLTSSGKPRPPPGPASGP